MTRVKNLNPDFITRLKVYYPSVWALGIGMLFLMYPLLAALLVSGILFSFALFYGAVVYKFRQAQKRPGAYGDGFEAGFGAGGPSFRNVTTRMYQSQPFFKDVT